MSTLLLLLILLTLVTAIAGLLIVLRLARKREDQRGFPVLPPDDRQVPPGDSGA